MGFEMRERPGGPAGLGALLVRADSVNGFDPRFTGRQCAHHAQPLT
jgi:hypothetical protein